MQLTTKAENFLKDLGINNNLVVRAAQEHKNKIAIVTKKQAGEKIAGIDGLVTKENNLFLVILVADCIPVLAYDPTKRIVGVAHAGWRGTLGKIAQKLIGTFVGLGSKTEDIRVAFGPAIEFCHYEIKDDVASKFVSRGFSGSVLRTISGKIYLDLKKANMDLLKKVGIRPENVDASVKACTYEMEDFYSWRGGNKENRIAALIGNKNG
jgi:YfiH family protein